MVIVYKASLDTFLEYKKTVKLPDKHGNRFQNLDEKEKYDGIWACSSILHLTGKDLADVFSKTARALKDGGVMYTSFKRGTFEGIRNGRQFTDMTEGSLKDFIEETNVFTIRELWVSADVRPGREEEKWVNVILEKK